MTKTYKTIPGLSRENTRGKIIHKKSEKTVVALINFYLIIVITYEWNFSNICSDTRGYA